MTLASHLSNVVIFYSDQLLYNRSDFMGNYPIIGQMIEQLSIIGLQLVLVLFKYVDTDMSIVRCCNQPML